MSFLVPVFVPSLTQSDLTNDVPFNADWTKTSFPFRGLIAETVPVMGLTMLVPLAVPLVAQSCWVVPELRKKTFVPTVVKLNRLDESGPKACSWGRHAGNNRKPM